MKVIKNGYNSQKAVPVFIMFYFPKVYNPMTLWAVSTKISGGDYTHFVS